MNEFLANGGKIKRLPAKKRAIIYGEKGANYVDALRQRAKRGKKAEGTLADIMAGRTSLGLMTEQESKEKSKKEAKEELEWFGCRALPRPYAPIKELACDAHSIRSNIPWDFEDRFLDSLKTPDGRLWGDVFFEAYDHDHMELDPGDAGYKPSATVNDLVRPDFTSSLDRMFGAEVDEKSLKCDSLRGAPKRVQKASKAFDPIWNAVLSELRLEEAKNRGDWHDLLKCPS